MKIKFKKQNEVSHWLNIITMIVTIDLRLFPDKKSKNFQNVLFGNCSIGIYRMLQRVILEEAVHCSFPDIITFFWPFK